MAERSTAAVDVAGNSGDDPLTAQAGEATADGVEAQEKNSAADADAVRTEAAHKDPEDVGKATAPESDIPEPPELHSGHKLARRYRLEECVTRLDGFSSWRAVDEKLRRAVGVHILPADHPRARPTLAAARSAALLGDPRFVQVLDAVEEGELVYVVHEWLPDATELTAVLASGPLEPHEAYQLVSQVSQAMAVAHREGLAHLRLTPGSVLRTESGQYRIRGLAVMAALRGISTPHPQRTDTEAIGALLYAALTQRWPYENDAYGLSGLPKGVGLIAPDQVRAGVHRGLAEIAMRALANDGSTPLRMEPPCTTPEELSKAVAALPRIRPPEPSFATPTYQPPTYQQPAYGPKPPGGGVRPAARPVPPPPPPPLQSRTGKALKWAVSALLIAALGLGSWQVADILMDRGEQSAADDSDQTSDAGQDGTREQQGKPTPLKIEGAEEFDPEGSGQAPESVGDTYDGDKGTFWRTKTYDDGPAMAPYKSGAGIVYDLGSARKVSSAELSLLIDASYTQASVYVSGSRPADVSSLEAMPKLGTAKTSGNSLKINTDKPVEGRYAVVWFTALPPYAGDQYRGSGYAQALTEVAFTAAGNR